MLRFQEERRSTWTIVLAGGEGMRLRRLVRRIHGEDRPKQFAPVASERSLLRETLDRMGTVYEGWALDHTYALAPPRDFSRDVLEPGHAELTVAHMPQLTRCDQGTPRRVFQLGLRPPWLDEGRTVDGPRVSA